MQPHQGAGASAQLQLHLQQMQAQALRQQQNANQQQQLMSSNGGFGNMSPNVQGPGHFVGQQVDQSHQQGNSQMGHRNSFSQPNGLMGPSGLPNNSGMCMLPNPNQMGNHQQMVQGQPSPGNGSGQNNGAHAQLLWNAVQASSKQGGNMNANSAGGMNMGGSSNSSSLKMGIMGNSQMQGMGQHSKSGNGQGFNNSQLQQQQNFNASGSSDGNSSMSSGNMNKDIALLQQYQAQQAENLKNPAANNNQALLLQQQNLIQQLMRQVQQQQAQGGSNSGGSNSQPSPQGMQFPQMNQRPGSSMGPSNQSMQHSSATNDMMSGILRGRDGANSSNSSMGNNNGQQQQQQKSGDQLNFPGMFPGNQQQQGMGNSNHLNSPGPADTSLFGNSNANNSTNMNTNGGMSMPFQNKMSQGHNMGFNDHVNQGFGMNPMVDLTPQQRLLLMNQQNRPSSSQGPQQAMLQQEQYRKFFQKISSEKKRLSTTDSNTDDASISSKQDEDSGGKSPKGKSGSKRGRRNSKTQGKNGNDSNSNSDSNKKNKSSKDGDSSEVASDSFSDNQDGSRGQRPFLDGNFAGGWQSNADLPDRKRIIISIVKLVERMRPDASKMSQKLPLMAKRLEEYLYRAASTKEEYMDSSTLKKRLQKIAHGLGNLKPYQQTEQERPSSASSGQNNSKDLSNDFDWFPNLLPANAQDKKKDGQGNKDKDSLIREVMKSKNMKNGKQSASGESNAEADAKARKTIKQQQQRLLLLRHASKCKEGPNCKTRFCDQMVALWKHMKNCRDKNCKTPHCLSSRCVLNHYRICKNNGRTATCEVCGPVLKDIGGERNISGSSSSMECFPAPFGSSGESPLLDDVPSGSNSPKTAGGALPDNAKQCAKFLEEIKAAQNKIRQQQSLLQHLQNQQLQLLEQQKNASQPQRAQQLKQQQVILQMQNSFQPQQTFCQRELERQAVFLQRKQQLLQRQLVTFKNQPQSKDKVKDETRQIPESLLSSTVSLDSKDATKPRSSRGKKSSGSEPTPRRRNSKTPGKTLKKPKDTASKSLDKISPDEAVSAKTKAESPDSNKDSSSSSGKTKASSGSTKSSGKRSVGAISKDASDIKVKEEPSTKMIKLENEITSTKKGTTKDKNKVKEVPEDSGKASKSLKKGDAGEKVLQQGESETNTSLVPSMSVDAIEGHIESLQEESSTSLSPRRVTQKCLPLVKRLIDDKFGWVFRDPVDPEELGLPDYFNVIKHPMDLGRIVTQLENNEYTKFEAFEKDVRLVFENAILYNGDNSDVGDMAKSLLSVFETDYKTLMKG